MIGTASKIGGKLGFVQFMSSGAMNNMLLFNGICIAGIFGVLTSVKKESMKSKLILSVICLIVVGNIPFIAADEENIYKFVREPGSLEGRINDGTESEEKDVTRGDCNEQSCIVNGKIILTKKDYVGSMTVINLSDDSGTLVSKTVKLITKEFSSEASLIYDYSQCDYSIGIVEGTSFEGSLDDPETDWKNRNVFYDNADNLIDMSVAPSDLSRLPNNLREFTTSSIQSSGECGSWHTQGTIKSRQVVIPKRDCYSMFQTSDDAISHVVTEIYLDDVMKRTASLSEMQDGVELEPGLKVSLIGLNPPNKRKLRMFCRMQDNNLHKDCYEYNYPSIGNPTLEGPGSFQLSKVPAIGIDNKEMNYFFGRSEWNNAIRWFRQGSDCSGSEEREFLEDYSRIKDDWMSGKSSRVIGQGSIKEKIKNKQFKEGKKSLFMGKKSEVMDILSSLGFDDERKRKIVSSIQPKFGGWFLAMLVMIAILVIAASIATPIVMWNNDKDKCCGIERYGTTGLDWMTKFGRNINDTYGSDMPEFKWSTMQNGGEPMGNSVLLRDSSGKVNTYAIEIQNYQAEIDNSKVIVESLEITEVTSYNSGANGNAKLVIFTIGAGGTIKLNSKGAKLMNNFINVRPGKNTYIIGLVSFEYDKSVVEICIESENNICSSKEVNFVSNPNGENNGLGSEPGKMSVLATFGQLFNSNGWWACTYVLVCILSAIIGILMIVALYNLIMNCKGYNLKGKRGMNVSSKDMLLHTAVIICCIHAVNSEMLFNVNRTTVEGWNLTCYRNSPYRLYANDYYESYVILSAADKNFTTGCDASMWRTSLSSKLFFNNVTNPCVKGGVDPVFPVEGTGAQKNVFNGLWAYKAITRNGSSYTIMSYLPYFGTRKLDMMFISMSNLMEFESDGKLTCVSNSDSTIKEGGCERAGKRICMDTKWTIYKTGCGVDGGSGGPETFCYGCYNKFCRFTKSDTYRRACFVLDGATVEKFGASAEGATVNIYESGVDVLMSYNSTFGTQIVSKPLLCEKEIVFVYNLIGYQGYFSGSEMWSLKLELSVDSEDIFTRSRSLSSDICSSYDAESFVSIAKCITGKGIAQCILICEMLSPDRPSSVNGKVKRVVSGRRSKELKRIFGDKNIMRKGITREQKRVFEEITNDNSRPSLSKMSRSVDPGLYNNVWFTNEGVAFGARLGGPYKVNCFYGDGSGSYCNNTQGYGVIGGVTVKSVNSAGGSKVYYPEKEQGITLTYEGIDCMGIINDSNGTLRCDMSCCMVSFDNFDTVSVYYAGEEIHPTGNLGLSNVAMAMSRSEGERDPGIYPQRVNSDYNETCIRGASVSELWVCVSNYYPAQFWGPIGFIIAASVLTIVFLIWRFGIRRAASKAWSGTKGVGSWVGRKGKSIADVIYSSTMEVNRATKLKLAGKLESSERLLDSLRGDKKYEEEVVKLREKMNYWKTGTGMKGDRMSLIWLANRSIQVGTELARYDERRGNELRETGQKIEQISRNNSGKGVKFN